MDVNAIEDAIDELVAFKFPEFTPHFLQGMKKEVVSYKGKVDATRNLNEPTIASGRMSQEPPIMISL